MKVKRGDEKSKDLQDNRNKQSIWWETPVQIKKVRWDANYTDNLLALARLVPWSLVSFY